MTGPRKDDERPGDVMRVLGARENNLKGFDLELQRHQILAVVGVSGSGKSSLLFRTLAAESEVRHETLVARAQRKPRGRRPLCDRIDGLPFCLTVSQRSLHRNPRSTVATFTGLHDAVRRLVIQYGDIRCVCGALVPPTDLDRVLTFLDGAHTGGSVSVGAIVAREPLPSLSKLERALASEGIKRVALQALPGGPRRERALKGLGALDQNQIHAIVVPVGEQRISKGESAELRAVAKRAFALGSQGVFLTIKPKKSGVAIEVDTSLQSICDHCYRIHRRPTTSLLSFNSVPERSGRCSRCAGLGLAEEVAIESLVPDPEKSIEDGCFALRQERGSYKYLGIRKDVVRGVCLVHGETAHKPFGRMNESARNAILFGMDDTRVQPIDESGKKSGAKVRYHGLIPSLRKIADAPEAAGEYARGFVSLRACGECQGTRFNNEALAAYVYGGRRFTEMLGDAIEDSLTFLNRQREHASGQARQLLDAASRVLDALTRAGLGYLGINRSSATLSGGELQRLKIAASLHEGIVRSCYILDEPSLGLHAVDNRGLLGVIEELRERGNTIVIADHDHDFIAAADQVITLGPGAGARGGELLSVELGSTIKRKTTRRQSIPLDSTHGIQIGGATANNLAAIDVFVPLGGLVCLTGVSGSGKSSFAHQVLLPAVQSFLSSGRTAGPTWRSFCGGQWIRKVARVGQQPIGNSMVSVLATYLELYDTVRSRFASTEEARIRGYSAAHFSFNRPEGRCPACSGRGVVEDDTTVDLIDCTQCGGSRFVDAILDVRWRGLSVGDVLRMEVSRAAEFFADESDVAPALKLLVELGVGHLQLGRPTPTLSGGESQRLKLVHSLSKLGDRPEGLVFILDEPTAGLHHSDVESLLCAFERIISGGKNTVIVVEHDLDVIAQADWIIDFGPGAGKHGGRVVYAGPPQGAKLEPASRTGDALRHRQNRHQPEKRPAPAQSQHYGLLPSLGTQEEKAREAERFLGALRKLDLSPASDGEETLEVVSPSYLIAAEPKTFAPEATVLDAIGLTERLHRVLLPHVRFSPVVSVEPILDASHALALVRRITRTAVIGFCPITPFLESGDATRSKALGVLEACASRGFERFVGNDIEQPLTGLKRKQLDNVDLFSLRVVADTLPEDDSAALSLLEGALAAGHGWIVVRETLKGGKIRETQMSTRPLSFDQRRIGRKRWVPGLLDRRASGGCPYCRGRGRMLSFAEHLIIADHRRSLLSAGFLTPGAHALFRPILSRLQKTLEFMNFEGIMDLLSSPATTALERGMLLHGYPFARFLIPGRSGDKNVDFYEWEGLFPVLDERLHLAADSVWQSRVEASRSQTSCFDCEGTGFNWQMRHSTGLGVSIPELLSSMPLVELAALAARHLHERTDRILLEALDDLVRVGLGAISLATVCRELSRELIQKLRAVAVKYLHFAEATHYLSFDQPHLLAEVTPMLTSAAIDSSVRVAVGRN